MPGWTPDEGEDYCAEQIYSTQNLQLILFTNDPALFDETTVFGDLVEPSTGGYGRKTLTAGNWVLSNGGIAQYAKQRFDAGAGGFGNIYGYAIITIDATPRILHIEIYSAGPVNIVEGQFFEVDPYTLAA